MFVNIFAFDEEARPSQPYLQFDNLLSVFHDDGVSTNDQTRTCPDNIDQPKLLSTNHGKWWV